MIVGTGSITGWQLQRLRPWMAARDLELSTHYYWRSVCMQCPYSAIPSQCPSDYRCLIHSRRGGIKKLWIDVKLSSAPWDKCLLGRHHTLLCSQSIVLRPNILAIACSSDPIEISNLVLRSPPCTASFARPSRTKSSTSTRPQSRQRR